MKFPDYQPGDLVIVNRDWTLLGQNYPRHGDTVKIARFSNYNDEKEPCYLLQLSGGSIPTPFWAGHFYLKEKAPSFRTFIHDMEEEVCKAT